MHIQHTDMALIAKMTGAAAQHVQMMRVLFARDAYEVFGWTAATVFTFADMEARWAEFHEAMNHDDLAVWRRQPQAVREAVKEVMLGAFARWKWAMDIVADRQQVMHDLSGGETDMEA